MFNYTRNHGSRSMRSNTNDLRQRWALRYDDDAVEERCLRVQAIIAHEQLVSRRMVSLSVIRRFVEALDTDVSDYMVAYIVGRDAIQVEH